MKGSEEDDPYHGNWEEIEVGQARHPSHADKGGHKHIDITVGRQKKEKRVRPFADIFWILFGCALITVAVGGGNPSSPLFAVLGGICVTLYLISIVGRKR